MQWLAYKSPVTPHNTLYKRQAQMKNKLNATKKKIIIKTFHSITIYGVQTLS